LSNTAVGGAQTVEVTANANDINISPTGTPLTIQGSPADDDLVIFDLFRDDDGGGCTGNDDLNASVSFIGMKITYTLNAATSD